MNILGKGQRIDTGNLVLQREEQIAAIFDFKEKGSGKNKKLSWEAWCPKTFIWCRKNNKSSSISDDLVNSWKDCISTVTIGRYDKPGEVLSRYEPERLLYAMQFFGILKEGDLSYWSLQEFFAERAALANWDVSEDFCEYERVPITASIWWEKFILLPRREGPNPIKRCGFLIGAGLLPEYFTLKELLRLALERVHVTITLGYNLQQFLGRAVPWELSKEGIEAAERLGLLSENDDVNVSRNMRIMPVASVGSTDEGVKKKPGRKPLSGAEKSLAKKICAARNEKPPMSMDEIRDEYRSDLTVVLRKKQNRGENYEFDDDTLLKEVRRLRDTGRKWSK